jgi:hypothetical protein
MARNIVSASTEQPRHWAYAFGGMVNRGRDGRRDVINTGSDASANDQEYQACLASPWGHAT